MNMIIIAHAVTSSMVTTTIGTVMATAWSVVSPSLSAASGKKQYTMLNTVKWEHSLTVGFHRLQAITTVTC